MSHAARSPGGEPPGYIEAPRKRGLLPDESGGFSRFQARFTGRPLVARGFIPGLPLAYGEEGAP